MSKRQEPLWATVLLFVFAPLLIQPIMFVLDIGAIFLTLGNSFPKMQRRSWILMAAGLAWLYFGRKTWRRRPFLVQMPIGLVLAPIYVRLFWYMLARAM
jgi:hypothetical protein